MKKFRAFTASILASAMVMSMTAGFAAFAEGEEDNTTPVADNGGTGGTSTDNDGQDAGTADDNNADAVEAKYVITINNIKDDKAKHTYEAYQIFAGDVQEVDGNKSFDITGWGTGVDTTELAKILEDIDDFKNVTINDTVDSAKAVADVLKDKEYENDDANMQAFANAVGKALGTEKTASKEASDDGTTDIGVADGGYYLIQDTSDSPDSKHSAKTRYILTVAEKLEIEAKADYPTIDKVIVEDGKDKEANTVSIGDVVDYKLTSKVPDMTGYNKYYYIVNDSMFKGLTLDAESFKISINGTDLEADAFYYKDVDDTKADYDDFQIVFVDFLQYQELKGKDIVITYNAILNENAKIGSEGNPNFVDLTFSNDPTYDYNGNKNPDKPDEPNPGTPDDPDTPEDESKPGDPTGVTPEHKVITYTAGIELIKVDAKDPNKTLSGAKFKITGDGLNTVVTYQTKYEASDDGEYYQLKDGTYTKTEPNDKTADKYESTETKYKQTEETVKETYEKGDTDLELRVDDKGVLRLYGLGDGEYTIQETEAPEGYVLKKDAIKVTIESEPTIDECKWTFTGPEGTSEDGIFTFNFANPKGVLLPGTGAFGSTLIYALGTLFTGTSAAYMVSKKKSKKD